jgi:hypothetical protein
VTGNDPPSSSAKTNSDKQSIVMSVPSSTTNVPEPEATSIAVPVIEKPRVVPLPDESMKFAAPASPPDTPVTQPLSSNWKPLMFVSLS